MPKNFSLFGREIIPSGKLTLTEQIYDIICEEIHSGRWKIGEQLPSISAMATESGLSRRPIQLALDRIRGEGYVRQEKGAGTFLISLLPKGRTPIGTIGVLVHRRDPDNLFGLALQELDRWRIHTILQEASERNYTEEIKYLDKTYNGSGIDKVGGLFSDRVKGIISLHDFPREDQSILSPDKIPFVFLGYGGFRGRPCVALDLEKGFYELTKEVIAQGHRSIICFGGYQSVEMPSIFAGYERAMREAHLPINREAFEQSLTIPPGQLALYADYLREHTAPGIHRSHVGESNNNATAIVCPQSERAMSIIAVADMLGIHVPEDLSVVSLVAGPMRAYKPNQRVTGIEYDLEHTVRVCFDLLTDQMKTRRSLVSVVRVKPIIRKGESLGPLPAAYTHPRSGIRSEKKRFIHTDINPMEITSIGDAARKK